MKCFICNSENNDNSQVCSFCGNPLTNTQVTPPSVQPNINTGQPSVPQNINTNQPSVNPIPVVNNKQGMPMWQKIIILVLLIIVIILLAVVLLFGDKKPKFNSRTIMIFIDGANLESQAWAATADMASIDPSKIDFDTTNIIVYTGGSQVWHNFVSNQENAIYKLTPTGYEKIETYPKTNLGDGKELTKFLKYGYDNYPADQFNLILSNHGGAYQGVIEDQLFNNDVISLEELDEVFKNSPFNGENAKLNTIEFRTCLMGNFEAANVLKKYSKYMIAAEEETYSGYNIPIMGGAINDLKVDDDEIETGKKFADSYYNVMIDYPKVSYPITYSVIDLSKIDELAQELNKVVQGVDVAKNYSKIVKMRNSFYQFPSDPDTNEYYDLIDFKALIELLSKYSSVKTDKLEKAFDAAIVYNKTDLAYSNGLSIYFPAKASKRTTNGSLEIYKGLKDIDSYKKFVNSIVEMKNDAGYREMTSGVSNMKTEEEGDKKYFSYQLDDELYENYKLSQLFLFRKNDEYKNYYDIVLNSTDVELRDDKTIRVSLDNLLYTESPDGDKMYLPTINRKINDMSSIRLTGIMNYKEVDFSAGKLSESVNIYLTNNNGKVEFGEITLRSRDERIAGKALLDMDKFSSLDIFQSTYKILDSNGKVMDNEDWESHTVTTGAEFKLDDIDLEFRSIDDGEWYILFYIYDVNDNFYSSDLIKVGE